MMITGVIYDDLTADVHGTLSVYSAVTDEVRNCE